MEMTMTMVARVAAKVAAKGRNKVETKPGARASKRNAAKVGICKPLTQQEKRNGQRRQKAARKRKGYGKGESL